MDADLTEPLSARIRTAADDGTPLAIAGGGTKDFLGRITQAERFDVSTHRGIVTYEPTELVLSARGGTPLAEVNAVLAEKGQTLAFEPPAFGEAATIGGAVAAGLSGPARPYAGAARDFVLGTRVLNGRGEALRFGGEVMKNVAGYDVSRLMTGAFGTLGVLLEVSLKVLPRPARVRTLAFETSAEEAIARCNAWAAKPLPITGACHHDGRLYVRLAGTAGGVAAAADALGGETGGGETVGGGIIDGETIDGGTLGSETSDGETGGGEGLDGGLLWTALGEQTLPFFTRDGPPLWRVSAPPGAAAPGHRRRLPHRLGRRAALAAHRRAGRGGARRRRARWRTRDPLPRRRPHRRRVPPPGPGGIEAPREDQGRLRPGRHPQPRPDVRGDLTCRPGSTTATD